MAVIRSLLLTRISEVGANILESEFGLWSSVGKMSKEHALSHEKDIVELGTSDETVTQKKKSLLPLSV